jgi:uncharacterized protein YjbJ (UPF0337 family)
MARSLIRQDSTIRRKQMSTGTKDEIKGKFHEVKGKVKEKTGQVTNNPDLEAEGKAERRAGKIEKKVGQIEVLSVAAARLAAPAVLFDTALCSGHPAANAGLESRHAATLG